MSKLILTALSLICFSMVYAMDAPAVDPAFQIAEGTPVKVYEFKHSTWPAVQVTDNTGGLFDLVPNEGFIRRHPEVKSSFDLNYNGKPCVKSWGGRFNLCESLTLLFEPTKDGIGITEVDTRCAEGQKNTYLLKPDHTVQAVKALTVHYFLGGGHGCCGGIGGGVVEEDTRDPKPDSNAKMEEKQ